MEVIIPQDGPDVPDEIRGVRAPPPGYLGTRRITAISIAIRTRHALPGMPNTIK